MVRISVLYPNEPGKRFDHTYYAQKHLPLLMDRLKGYGMLRYEVDKGLAGGGASPARFPSSLCRPATACGLAVDRCPMEARMAGDVKRTKLEELLDEKRQEFASLSPQRDTGRIR